MFTSSVVVTKHSFTSTPPQVQLLTKVKGLVYSNFFFFSSINYGIFCFVANNLSPRWLLSRRLKESGGRLTESIVQIIGQ